MDAVISIGGQSFLDGLIRILGPALTPLRTPMPITLPGIANGTLSIRGVQPVLPGGTPGMIELDVEIDLKGEVLLVASVAAGVLNLNLGTGTINLQPSTGNVTEPVRTGNLTTDKGNGTVAGTIVGTTTTTLALTLDALTGKVVLPAATAPLSLDAIGGTFVLPANFSNLALPLPAVVPVAVDFTRGAPLVARISLSPIVNGAVPGGGQAFVTAASGFALDFGFRNAIVTLPNLAGNITNLTAALQGAINTALNALLAQLLQGLPGIQQPVVNVQGVATAVATAIPAVLQSTLADAFNALKARTGRLIYPTRGSGASCDVRALPTDAKALMTIAADGSIVLQVGFDRLPIPIGEPFPPFAPTGILDTGVTITNTFLRDLLVCVIEKFPNLALPPLPPVLVNTPPSLRSAAWAPITLNLGPLSLSGSLTLAITGLPAGLGAPPKAKRITLAFSLGQSISVPWVVGSALDIMIDFTLPIAFDLSKVTSITALRLMGAPMITTFSFGLGAGLTTMLALAGAVFALPGLVGPFPIALPALITMGILIAIVPHIVTGIIGVLLRNTLNTVLSAVGLLESPVALPPGILDAFGTLVPTTMVVDQLEASGMLNTPTSPWAVLPISMSGKQPPRGGGPD